MGHGFYLMGWIALGLGLLLGYVFLFRFIRHTNTLLKRALMERDVRVSSFWSFAGHDFKNHLQMISLMAELGMQRKIGPYVQKVVAEINEWNKMWQNKHPEILLSLLQNRSELELGTTLTIQTDLKHLPLSPRDALVFWELFLDEIEKMAADVSNLKIHLAETEEAYHFCFSFVEERRIFPLPEDRRVNLSSLVKGYGGSVTFKPLPGKIMEISIFFRKEVKGKAYALAVNDYSIK